MNNRTKIIEAYSRGDTVSVIAADMSLTKTTVYGVLNRAGIQVRKNVDWLQVRSQFENGENVNKIAAEHGISHRTIYHYSCHKKWHRPIKIYYIPVKGNPLYRNPRMLYDRHVIYRLYCHLGSFAAVGALFGISRQYVEQMIKRRKG